MKLSIVATLYRSAPHIKEFYQRVSEVAKQVAPQDYSILLVNDGSPDHSLELAVEIAKHDSRVTVIDLSRNFGHHKAMMTGLSLSQGDRVFLIDSDLEEEPECLLRFVEVMNERECDVVYGVQDLRKGHWFERWSGDWFYQIFRLLTGLKLPSNIVTARLMTRRYVDALVRHQEREVFMAGLWFITGFDQVSEIIKKHNSSQSSYTLRRKIDLLINSITSFSNAPLVSIFYIGAIISFFALLYATFIIINWTFLAIPLTGWTSVMASIWLLGGMIISFIGIIGVYLSKIFSETKQRPYTIIRQIYEYK